MRRWSTKAYMRMFDNFNFLILILIKQLFYLFTCAGLDPARPLIENKASAQFRLTRDDANVVQIIHTNAGGLGQISRTGSVDFCINGGKMQPFCHGHLIST